MRVLVAPQEFKGSLSAREATDAIAEGIHRARPDWQVDRCPMSDGGPGFVESMAAAIAGSMETAVVRDPLGRRVKAVYLLSDEGDAFVESAQANGLFRLAADERDALRTSTEGVGDLLLAAAAQRPARIVAGVGGSATSDGGSGMARALGARLRDMAGRQLAPGGGALGELASIEWQRPAVFGGIDIVVATDVTNPLVGPDGAARVYAPQKGASPHEVDLLEAALYRYVQVLRRALGVDVAAEAGAGAAGGLAAGLVAFLGARIVSGFDVLADAVGLRERVRAADVVVTGEGSYDAQSVRGKTAWRIAAMAREERVPCHVFAGRAETPGDNVDTVLELEPDPGRAMANGSKLLARLAERWADRQSVGGSRPD